MVSVGQSVATWARRIPILRRLLPSSNNDLAVRIDALDKGGRFGLANLDGVYNGILILATLSIINWTFGQLSNYAKGSCGPLSYDLLWILRPFLALGTLIPVVYVAIYPLFGAWVIGERAKEHESDKLNQMQTSKDDIDDKIKKSTVWPWKETKSRNMFALFGGVLILAFSAKLAEHFLPKGVTDYLVMFTQIFPEKLCQFLQYLGF